MDARGDAAWQLLDQRDELVVSYRRTGLILKRPLGAAPVSGQGSPGSR